MYQQGRMKKKNKIKTLGTERCKNIPTLHKIIIFYGRYVAIVFVNAIDMEVNISQEIWKEQ